MNKVEPKKVLMGLAGAFIALSVWNNPQDAGKSTGDFISNATSWVGDVFDKANEFSKSVIE